MKIDHVIAVEVKYYGPSNHRGSRLRLSLPRTAPTLHDDPPISRKFISAEGIDNHREIAATWIREQIPGLEPFACADMGRSDVLLYQWYKDGPEWQNAFARICEALDS